MAVIITAREMTADAAGTIVATGRVRIADGTYVAEAERAVLDPRRRTAILTPGVVRGPQGVLRGTRLTVRFSATRLTEIRAEGRAGLSVEQTQIAAEEITLRPGEESLAAEGRVRVTAPPDLRAEGRRLLLQRRTGRLSLSGSVRVLTAEGVAEGTRLEAGLDGQEVRMSGGVRARFGDITARAEALTLHPSAKRAVLTGAVRVEQGGRVLWAERVTVEYGVGRIVAAGPLRMTRPSITQYSLSPPGP